MRKTNRNIKRVKLIKSLLNFFIIGQVLILLLFMLSVYDSRNTLNVNNRKVETIVVQDVAYAYVYNTHECRIYSNDVRYDFPSLGIEAEYSSRELYETIRKGEVLRIIYTKEYSLFGRYNLILDARSGETVYLDIDWYISQVEKGSIGMIVILSLFEAALVFGVVVSIWFNKDLFPRKYKKRGKRQIPNQK